MREKGCFVTLRSALCHCCTVNFMQHYTRDVTVVTCACLPRQNTCVMDMWIHVCIIRDENSVFIIPWKCFYYTLTDERTILCVYQIFSINSYRQPRNQSSWGQHGTHLGPVGPRWAPCWPHEACYQGHTVQLLNCTVTWYILPCVQTYFRISLENILFSRWSYRYGIFKILAK